MRWSFFAFLLASLLLPASASAAALTIGSGSKPGIAVDDGGTAYIAWYGTETAGPVSLHFCRLPRDAAACDVSTTLTPPGQTLSRPFVRVSGSRVDIVNSRYGFTTGGFDQTLLFTSTDGGVTFSGSTQASTAQIGFDEAMPGPGDAVTVATNADTNGGIVQSIPLNGQSSATSANLFPTTYLYNGTVGLNGSTPVAVFTDASSNAAVRVLGAGDPNTEANWSAAAPIGYADYPRLASGPLGLFMLAGTPSGGLEVRRFDGSSFGSGAALTGSGDASEAHLYADAGGRLHAVWSRVEVDGWHLYHSVSDDGVNWRSGTVTTQADDQEGAERVATAPDHVGYAVWTSRDAAGTSEVRVASVGPDAPAAPAPPAQQPPPPPAPTPVPTPVFHKTVVVRVVSGTVRVKRPGSKSFVTLKGTDSVPLKSTVDVKKGRLALSSVPKSGAKAETAQFYSGIFSVTQAGSITELRLNEALASCKRSPAKAATKKPKKAAKKPKSRKLWGDGSGSFRTRGQYSSATVRGTRWLVQDTCSGTRTRVSKGAVTVRDLRRKKNVIVRAGKSYLARAPKR